MAINGIKRSRKTLLYFNHKLEFKFLNWNLFSRIVTTRWNSGLPYSANWSTSRVSHVQRVLTSSVCNQTWRSLTLARGHLTNTFGKSFSPPKIQATIGSWWRSFTDGDRKRQCGVSKRTAKPFEDTMTSSKRAEFTRFRAKHMHHSSSIYIPKSTKPEKMKI